MFGIFVSIPEHPDKLQEALKKLPISFICSCDARGLFFCSEGNDPLNHTRQHELGPFHCSAIAARLESHRSEAQCLSLHRVVHIAFEVLEQSPHAIFFKKNLT